MENEFLDTEEDFDGDQNYRKVITITPVLGGWTVHYSDKNPNYAPYVSKDGKEYDPKINTEYFSRTRIFTDATKVIEWMTSRIKIEWHKPSSKVMPRDPVNAKIYNKKYYDEHRDQNRQWCRDNKDKIKAYRKTYNKTFKFSKPETYLLGMARRRAKELGLVFTITEADIHIPARCPILDIPLFFSDGKSSPNSPSIDKIDPTGGYTPDNIGVISFRANYLKSNLKQEDIARMLDYVQRKNNVTNYD